MPRASDKPRLRKLTASRGKIIARIHECEVEVHHMRNDLDRVAESISIILNRDQGYH